MKTRNFNKRLDKVENMTLNVHEEPITGDPLIGLQKLRAKANMKKVEGLMVPKVVPNDPDIRALRESLKHSRPASPEILLEGRKRNQKKLKKESEKGPGLLD